MQVSLDWKQGLSFKGTAPSGHSVDLCAYRDVGGGGDGFAPEELVAIGLGGCTGMDVVSILRKKQQDVQKLQVRVTTQKKDEHPKVWTRALIEYLVTGANIDPSAVERAIQLSSEKYCLVQNMLKASVEIETRYEIMAP
ncbi:MAG TPA: OsmC family protein [Anaerolineales bacterium]|jgi:putative redox protein|nr:OsmC family protein [Anaerolineales bacterium]